MARTHDTKAMSVFALDSPKLTYLAEEMPEGASQTFLEGWPLKIASGLMTEWVNPGDADLWGFALQDGQNTTGATTRVVKAFPEIAVEANLLAAAAADHVLVAANLGAEVGLVKSATLLGVSAPGWYFQVAGTAMIVVEGFKTIEVEPTIDAYQPAVGDTNARVRGRVKQSLTVWN